MGYQREFLNRYRPNRDTYLSRPQMAHLLEAGHTPFDARPAGTYARAILDRLLIDLSWASSRLEGNTYNRLDTQRLIEFGQAAVGKPAQETQMILNHKAAIEMLIDGGTGFNRFTIMNLHALLSDNLLADPAAGGRLRRREAGISGTVYMPLAVPQQLEDAFNMILAKLTQIENPFEQAFFGMVHLPYLQPFEDVNKRVSRLAANIPLIRENLCPLSFVDMSERAYIDGTLGVYELNQVELLRDVFIWAYERSCQRYLAIRQSIGEPDALRMKYREAIQTTMQALVRSNVKGTLAQIRNHAKNLVAKTDLSAFVDTIAQDLDHLHEGNLVRYRLTLADFGKWKFKRRVKA